MTNYKVSYGRLRGEDLASWGMILGYVNLAVSILLFLWFFMGQLRP
jgi:hypothetical protein